jgi:hypothetical protein
MSRREKNRHHLATSLSILIGTPVLLACWAIRPDLQSYWMVATCLLLILFSVRTVLIERGVRRVPAAHECKFESSARTLLRRHFGICLED